MARVYGNRALNTADAAALLGISATTVRSWVRRGHLEPLPSSGPRRLKSASPTSCAPPVTATLTNQPHQRQATPQATTKAHRHQTHTRAHPRMLTGAHNDQRGAPPAPGRHPVHDTGRPTTGPPQRGPSAFPSEVSMKIAPALPGTALTGVGITPCPVRRGCCWPWSSWSWQLSFGSRASTFGSPRASVSRCSSSSRRCRAADSSLSAP